VLIAQGCTEGKETILKSLQTQTIESFSHVRCQKDKTEAIEKAGEFNRGLE